MTDDKYVAVPLDDEPWKDDDGNVLEPRLHRSLSWRLAIGYLEKDLNLGSFSINMSGDTALALATAILKKLEEDRDYVELHFDQGFDSYGGIKDVRCSISPVWTELEPLTDEEIAVVDARWTEKQNES